MAVKTERERERERERLYTDRVVALELVVSARSRAVFLVGQVTDAVLLVVASQRTVNAL